MARVLRANTSLRCRKAIDRYSRTSTKQYHLLCIDRKLLDTTTNSEVIFVQLQNGGHALDLELCLTA